MSDIRRLLSDDTVTTCEQCSGAMQYKGSGRYVCEECGSEVLNDFGKVKKYINDNGPSNAITISQGTGVSRQKIRNFLRDGRVEIVEDSAAGVLFCHACGIPIRAGKYCQRCQERLSNQPTHVEKGILNVLSEGETGRQKGQKRFDTRSDQK